MIADNQNEWIEAIKDSTLSNLENNRASLIICETKNQANTLYEVFSAIYRKDNKKGKVFLYTRDDNIESRAVENIFNTGDIMIATNLAGRGTDIKTSKAIEINGGLHVCVTYLPANLRVEEQAFGRTARQGNQGTAQLIINRDDLNQYYSNCVSIEEIRIQRSLIEKDKLNFFENKELSQINVKDEMFL